MIKLLLGAAALMAVAVFAIRWIVKLPARYERKPQIRSPWSALDNGIDPSIPHDGDS
jgi:hypothetical protein